MLNITVYCTSCGRRLRKLVDDTCPPSQLRCRCGARFPLRIDPEEPSLAGLSAGGSDGEAGETVTGRSLSPSSI